MDRSAHEERRSRKRDFHEITPDFSKDQKINPGIYEKLMGLREDAKNMWMSYKFAKERAEEDKHEYEHAARELQTKSLSNTWITKGRWDNMMINRLKVTKYRDLAREADNRFSSCLLRHNVVWTPDMYYERGEPDDIRRNTKIIPYPHELLYSKTSPLYDTRILHNFSSG
jgi:hypothetical protein